jgi:hypothetical protein
MQEIKDLPEAEKQAVVEMIPSIIDTCFTVDSKQNLHLKKSLFNCSKLQIAAILIAISSAGLFYVLYYAKDTNILMDVQR